jgi:hypothetical protein
MIEYQMLMEKGWSGIQIANTHGWRNFENRINLERI